jgi:hypothetical protein
MGPAFEFFPSRLPPLEQTESGDISLYDSETGVLRPMFKANLLEHGEIIRFVHHAIEWENVNYILYPYAWTDPRRWDIKQALSHQDFYHQTFLRSGAARVVVTIRPGFEEAFLTFIEGAERLPSDHPYMRIAEEIKAMAAERYPYTPGGADYPESNRIDRWIDFTPTGALDVIEGPGLVE